MYFLILLLIFISQTTEANSHKQWINSIVNTQLLEQPITVVITSFKNYNWADFNLSVLDQEYDNFKVIYIDDASPDNTADKVQEIITKHPLGNKVTLVRNKKNIGQMANHYRAVHLYCADNDIVVHLDGDDALKDKQVLAKINTIYSNPNVWLTYGTAYEWPAMNVIWPKKEFFNNLDMLIKHNSFRDTEWNYGHLRTFRGWLFKQIKLQDLIYKSSFKKMSPAPDIAFMYPMLEMAGSHGFFIPNPDYLWNRTNPISQYNISIRKILDLAQIITRWEKYQPLAEPTYFKFAHGNAHADCLFFTQDIQKAQLVLAQITQKIAKIDRIALFYDKKTAKNIKLLKELQNNFPQVCYINLRHNKLHTIAKFIQQSKQEHMLLVTDNCSTIDTAIDIGQDIYKLEQTGALAFYYSINKKLLKTYRVPYCEVFDNLIAWQKNINIPISLCLFHKSIIYRRIAQLLGKKHPFDTNLLVTQLQDRKVGIAYL